MENKIRNVVLIDDDMTALSIITAYLNRTEKVENIVSFQSGKAALEYLKKSDDEWPEVILCDLVMPSMTGLEFLDNYAAMGYDSKPCLVCVHSSESDTVDFDDLEQRGHVHMFIPKPMNDEKLDQLFRFLEGQRKVAFQKETPLKYVLS